MPRAASAKRSSASNPGAILWVGAAVATLVALAAWWWWPRTQLATETATLAKELLDADGKPDRTAIRRVMTNVDRMPREEVVALWRSVGEEWRRLRQQAIDRYFTAPTSEKPQLLDAEIDRLAALRELLVALSPDADPRLPPRLPRDRGGRDSGQADAPPDAAARAAEANRRAVTERYDAALAAHAKSRGVVLPTFR